MSINGSLIFRAEGSITMQGLLQHHSGRKTHWFKALNVYGRLMTQPRPCQCPLYRSHHPSRTRNALYQGMGLFSLVTNMPVCSGFKPSMIGSIMPMASSASIAPSSRTCVMRLSTLPG